MERTLTEKVFDRVLRILPVPLQLGARYQFSRFRQRIIGPYAEAVLATGWNGPLLVSSSDYQVGHLLAFKGMYDKEAVESLLAMITHDTEVLVVGTHVGSILVPLAKKAGKVTGIEANPDTFRLLQMNIMLNGLSTTEVHNVAAGDRDGEIEFLKNRHNSGGSKAIHGWLKKNPLFFYDRPVAVKVPMRSLDGLFPGRRFDLVVMDIEGSEYFAFLGMEQILRQCTALQVEVSRISIEEVAHITPLQFVVPLKQYFSRARILTPGGKREYMRDFTNAEFDGMMTSLCSGRNASYDVLFLKGDDMGRQQDGSTSSSP
jgi:FkbM family methyltransferase